MTSLATAFVTIRPDTAGFGARLSTSTNLAADKAGAEGGKRMTSRFKGALKIGGLVAGAFAAVKVKDFLGDALGEARESQKVGALTASVIKATGGAAGVTAKQVGALSAALSKKTGIDDETIQSGQNMLLTFKNVRNEAGKGNDIFNQSTKTLVDLASAMGTEPKQAAIQLGKALNDPVKGISALSRVGVTFDEGQKNQIKRFTESGNVMKAQKIILKELNSEFGGAAVAQATAGEKAKVAFDNLKEQVGTALLPALDKTQNFLTTKIIPALSQFFTEMQSGEGAGGKFVAVVKRIGSVAKTAGEFLLDHKRVVAALGGAYLIARVGILAYTAAQKVATVATVIHAAAVKLSMSTLGTWIGVKALELSAWVRSAAATVASTAAVLANKVVYGGAWLAAFLIIKSAEVAAWVRSAAATVASTVSLVAHSVAMKAASAATKALAIAQRLLNVAMRANPIGLIVTGLVALGAGLVLAYKKSTTFRKIVDKAFDVIKKSVRTAWQDYIKPALSAMGRFITGTLAPAIRRLWNNVVKPAFAGIGKVIGFMWRNVVKPVFAALKFYLTQVLFPVIRFLWNNVVKPVFTGLGKTIGFVWRNAIKPVFGALRDGIGRVRDTFRAVVGKIKDIWGSLKSAARTPVKFVVNTVIGGLVKALNKIPGVSLPVPNVGFARGGSTGPGAKFQPAGIVHADEHVWTKEEMSRFPGGHRGMARLRKSVRHGVLSKLPEYWLGGGVMPMAGATSVSQHSGYGWARWAGDLNGVGDDTGKAVRAYRAGVVASATSMAGSYGNHIKVNHGAERTLYAHLSSIAVRAGQQVAAGQRLGGVGSTGNSSGPHLHFELSGGSSPLSKATGMVGAAVSAAQKAAKAKLASLKGTLSGLLEWPGKAAGFARQLGGSAWGKMLGKAPGYAIGRGIDWGKSKLGGLISSAARKVFDTGGLASGRGYMPKATLQPERVLSPKQTANFESLTTTLERLAVGRQSGGDSVLHLYDTDGVFQGSMRATARAEVRGSRAQTATMDRMRR